MGCINSTEWLVCSQYAKKTIIYENRVLFRYNFLRHISGNIELSAFLHRIISCSSSMGDSYIKHFPTFYHKKMMNCLHQFP